MFGRRPDGKLVRDLPALRRFMPFVSPRRNESLVWFTQEVDVEPALAWLTALNGDGERRVTLFHLVLRAIAGALAEKPVMNRFVAGGRNWQRDGVWITFSAKQRMEEQAPILTVKRRFDGDATLTAMVDGVLGRLGAGRGGARGASDKEVDLLLRLPPPLIRLTMWLAHRADALGLLPRSLIDADPLFASCFVANLGSVGLEAGYHHLWEWGNCPIFCVMGRVPEAGPRRVRLKWTFDERIADGFYAARALDVVRTRLLRPDTL